MTTKEMKAVYEANPDKWVVIYKFPVSSWQKVYDSLEFSDAQWANAKLIHIKHKQVLKAWLADNSVKIEYEIWDWRTPESYELAGYKQEYSFIENYNPDLEYRVKEKEDDKHTIMDNICTTMDNSNNTTESTKLNNFQDFGFTADFEGEILKEFESILIGYVITYEDDIKFVHPCIWQRDGECNLVYHLTPIKKEWYEQRPLKFPFAVSDTFKIRIVRCYDDLALAIDSGYDKATKEEVMSLYFDDKE